MFGTFDSSTVTASTTQVSETDAEIAVTAVQRGSLLTQGCFTCGPHRGETVRVC